MKIEYNVKRKIQKRQEKLDYYSVFMSFLIITMGGYLILSLSFCASFAFTFGDFHHHHHHLSTFAVEPQ